MPLSLFPVKMLAGLETQLDDLDGLGQLLSMEYVKADGAVRITDLQDLNVGLSTYKIE